MKIIETKWLLGLPLTLAACAGSVEPSDVASEGAGKAASAYTELAYDGERVQIPGDPTVYLVDRGLKRPIPDPATFNGLFENWNNIQVAWWAADLDVGAPIPEGAYLAQAAGDPAVYFVDNAVRRLVTSPAAMAKYNFSWSKVHTNIPYSLLYSLPAGYPMQ